MKHSQEQEIMLTPLPINYIITHSTSLPINYIITHSTDAVQAGYVSIANNLATTSYLSLRLWWTYGRNTPIFSNSFIANPALHCPRFSKLSLVKCRPSSVWVLGKTLKSVSSPCTAWNTAFTTVVHFQYLWKTFFSHATACRLFLKLK